MANIAAMRAMFERLGFTQRGAVVLTTTQGFDSLQELGYLKDGDVTDLCKALRRPGGTIPDPNAAAGADVPQVPNPGVSVSMMAETNLKLACFLVRHLARVSRTAQPADID